MATLILELLNPNELTTEQLQRTVLELERIRDIELVVEQEILDNLHITLQSRISPKRNPMPNGV